MRPTPAKKLEPVNVIPIRVDMEAGQQIFEIPVILRIVVIPSRLDRIVDVTEPEDTSHVYLTRREKEVVEGVIGNKSNKEIATSLDLSERTIKFHVSSLLSKFRTRSRSELRDLFLGRSKEIQPCKP